MSITVEDKEDKEMAHELWKISSIGIHTHIHTYTHTYICAPTPLTLGQNSEFCNGIMTQVKGE